MKIARNAIIASFLLIICVFIHIYCLDQNRVERGYSSGFYPEFASSFRNLFAWAPFSVGDILYAAALAWLLWRFFRFLQNRINKKTRVKGFRRDKFLRYFILLASLYIVFNIFWGINYNRKGIAWQLGLNLQKYSTEELREMNCLLLDKVNTSRKAINAGGYKDKQLLFTKTSEAYASLSVKYPFLKYENPSIKPALWGWLGNYAGFTGYYNPFSAEAQVNTTVPEFLHPFVACHEVAHQIGYAKEMEANFVGYLAATASTDTGFHYSVYLDMFLYSNRNLFKGDSVAAKIYRQDLIAEVDTDLEEWIRFSRKHRNPAEPVFRWMYGMFLQGNQQPQGILSYDEVTAFLIAYYRKFGEI